MTLSARVRLIGMASDSVIWFSATQKNQTRRLLGVALTISLLGITTATAAHEHVRGAEYSQSCTSCGVAHLPQQVNEAVKVPEQAYFAMGDNSPNSEDGRSWGFVPQGNMIGRAFMVFWPIRPFEVKFIR